MNIIFQHYDLDCIHNFFYEKEIIPLIESKDYLTNPIQIILPNFLSCEKLKDKFVEQFKIISPFFINDFSSFKLDLYNQLSKEALKNNNFDYLQHILLKKVSKKILMKRSLVLLNRENKLNYFALIWKYPSFSYDILNFYEKLKTKIPLFSEKLNNFKNYFTYIKNQIPLMLKKYYKKNQSEIVIKELLLILQKYENLKCNSIFLDENDQLHLSSHYMNNMYKDFPFKLPKRIYMLGIETLNFLEIELLDSLRKNSVKLTITIYNDKNRIHLFSQGEKTIKTLLIRNIVQLRDLPKNCNVNNFYKNNILKKISANLFDENYFNESKVIENSSCVELITAINCFDEIDLVMREIRKLLDKNSSLKFEDIAIIMRKPQHYSETIQQKSQFFSLPVYIQMEQTLIDQPLIQLVLLILELRLKNFPSNLLIIFIKSNYVFLKFDFFDSKFKKLFKQIYSHENSKIIINKINIYYHQMNDLNDNLIQYLEYKLKILKKNNFANKKNIIELELCILYLKKVIEIILVYPISEKIELYELGNQLKQHIIDFSIFYNIYQTDDLKIIKKDSEIMNKLIEVLSKLIYFNNHLKITKMSLNDFYYNFKEMLLEESIQVNEIKKKSLNFLHPKMIKGLKYKIVFILGLIEGIFPSFIKHNLLFSERDSFNLNDLFVDHKLQEDLYFFHSINSSLEKLYFCYSVYDNSNRENLPSFYIDDIELILGSLKEKEKEKENYAYHVQDIFQNIAYNSRINLLELNEVKKLVQPFILKESTVELLLSKIKCEQERYKNDFFGEYEGVLEHNSLIANSLKNNLKITASALERYGSCPHRFFYFDVLGLKKLELDEDFLNISRKGILMHKCLYNFYKDKIKNKDQYIFDKEIDSKKKIEQKIRAILNELEKNDFLLPRESLYFRGLERENLVNEVSCFIYMDLKESEIYKPLYLELSFGKGKKFESLIINDSEKNEKIQINGIIDRIDKHINNSSIRIIDYKSGVLPSKNELNNLIQSGQRFQPYLYSEKAKEICNQIKSYWYYYQIKCRKKSLSKREFFFDEKVNESNISYNKLISYYIHHFLKSIRKGYFPVNPQKCLDYCEFKLKSCRVNLQVSERKEQFVNFWKSLDTILNKIENS